MTEESLLLHLSKFPEWERGCDCCEVYHRWKRAHEKLLEAKVSQIQALAYYEERLCGHGDDCDCVPDLVVKLSDVKKALLVSPTTPTSMDSKEKKQ